MNTRSLSTADRDGLTAGEIRAWLNTVGVPDDAKITVQIGFRGQIRRIEAAHDDPEPATLPRPFKPVRSDRWSH